MFADIESKTLNAEQQEASDGFFKFLLSDEKELIISGPAGVGKTFLMGHLIDKVMPAYQQTCKLLGIPILYDSVEMTATTNKAAEVLSQAIRRPVRTIQSTLNLKVINDYATGTTRLQKTPRWMVHERKIIFVEECSFIDRKLYQHIQEGTHNCKIVYVGDHCQIPPVMESLSPIYTQNLPFFELKTPMRNAGQPALIELCKQLRHTVETGKFFPIKLIPGVIEYLDDETMEEALKSEFATQSPHIRVLAYANKRVNDYNAHIRSIRNLPSHFTVGEQLIMNSSIELSRTMINAEDRVEVFSVEDSVEDMMIEAPNVFLKVRYMDLMVPLKGLFQKVPVPEDQEHHQALIKYYAKKKDWARYFMLKDQFPDLRPGDACTFHKSQGSTHDVVFIDAGNLSTCHNANDVARMLYVGVSRAREGIAFYGDLAAKYGGYTW
jgi:exodeoxyribonuclease V